MPEEKISIDSSMIISSVRALWGMVPSTLRSVSIELRNDKIIWQCIFDKDASENDFELLSSASTEVIADYNDYGLEEILQIIPYPEKTQNLKNLVYLRYEHN